MHTFKIPVKKFIIPLLFAISVASCSNKKMIQPTIFSNEVVWQYSNYLNGLDGSSKNEFTANNFLISKISGSLAFPLVSYPIIGKDYMIVMDKKGVVARINNTTTKIDWKNIPSQKLRFFGDYLNGGLSQKGEKIYATYGSNLINCIDGNTGNLVWSKLLQEVVRAYPIVSKDVIFLQTLNNSVYALNAENGNIIWYKAELNEGVSVVNVISPVLHTHKNWLIIQGNTGDLTVINSKTGFEEWAVDSDDSMDFDMNFSRKGTLIYQPIRVNENLHFYSSSGYFYKLNLQDKRIVWKVKFNINRPFYLLNNVITAIDEMDNLVAINVDNGSELWKVKLIDSLKDKDKNKTRYWNSPVVINNNVYVLSSKGELLSFDLGNGKFVKVIYKMGYGSYIPPIYVGNKAFIISSK